MVGDCRCAVAVGFFMDLHVVGQHQKGEIESPTSIDASEHSTVSVDANTNGDGKHRSMDRGRRCIFYPHGHLSTEARAHIGFEQRSSQRPWRLSFLSILVSFSLKNRYPWNIFHMIIVILACCVSRAVIDPFLSLVANWITRIQQRRAYCLASKTHSKKSGVSAGVVIDTKMQIVLWFEGKER